MRHAGAFLRIPGGEIYVRPVLDEELAEPPVSMEGAGVESEIVPQRLQ
jgi:hypothetical protein